MLVLSRKPGEEIVIDGNIRVQVIAVRGDKVRLGITAPVHVPVDRAEVHARKPRGEALRTPGSIRATPGRGSTRESAACLPRPSLPRS